MAGLKLGKVVWSVPRKMAGYKSLVVIVVALITLAITGCQGGALRAQSAATQSLIDAKTNQNASLTASNQPNAVSTDRLSLQVQLAEPDEKGLVRGKIVNDTGRYVTDAQISLHLLDAAGVELPEPDPWCFGDLKYYVLAPGEEYPFLAFTKGKPGDKAEAVASAVESARPPLELKFVPESGGGEAILGRLQNNDRLIKSYELQALRIYLVPLDAEGLPQNGDDVRGWGLSMGRDLDHLNVLHEDLEKGQELVVKYNSVLPEDWRATRNVITSGRYKMAVTSWRPAPDFEQTPKGQILSEQEVRYILGLKGDAEIERMTYRAYLDKYKPGDYSYDIGDDTLLYIVTTQGTSLIERAGQYFNRHRTLLNAKTGFVYGSGHWWDPSEGPQPEGPGRFGGKRLTGDLPPVEP